ncbi:MAG: aspartate aminotransferase family protein [Candidatus Methanomethylicaceae archaeon]
MDLSNLHFSEAPRILKEPPGPKSRELLQAQQRLESSSAKYALEMPIALEEGRGATLKDVDGNIYIDFFSGIGVLNVGHSNPEVLQAAEEQMKKLIHTIEFPTRPRVELMEKLVEIAPGGLKGHAKVLFGGPTGSDAVAGAIKLAQYNTKRTSLLAFQGSYHGPEGSALAATSNKILKRDYLPLMPEVHFMPYPYCYRCPFNSKPDKCGNLCVEYLNETLRDPYGGVPDPAAIIVEAVQGSGGVIVPPDNFLPELKNIAQDHGILLIVDEIQSGFGRAGKMFASEHWGITPDIMPLAKSIGGIGFPLSATLFKEDLDTWKGPVHLGTFRGHAVAMAAGRAAIDFILEHNLLDHVTKLGAYALDRLMKLKEETKYIGDVRGKGLFIGIEFVKDKNTKEPYREIVKEIQEICYKQGLFIWTAGHYGNVIRLLPPLVITQDLLEKGLDILEKAVREAEERG